MSIVTFGICTDDTVSLELHPIIEVKHPRQGDGYSVAHWTEHSGAYQPCVWRATRAEAEADRADMLT